MHKNVNKAYKSQEKHFNILFIVPQFFHWIGKSSYSFSYSNAYYGTTQNVFTSRESQIRIQFFQPTTPIHANSHADTLTPLSSLLMTQKQRSIASSHYGISNGIVCVWSVNIQIVTVTASCGVISVLYEFCFVFGDKKSQSGYKENERRRKLHDLCVEMNANLTHVCLCVFNKRKVE